MNGTTSSPSEAGVELRPTAGETLTITSATGSISITGVSTGTTSDNVGVLIEADTQITSTGAAGGATITMNGTGSNNGVDRNFGVLLDDANGASPRVESVSGAISITGDGGDGTGEANIGILVTDASIVRSTGAATITLMGTGGTGGTANNMGVEITQAGTRVDSVAGEIEINGFGGGTTTGNDGVRIHAAAVVESTGSAVIDINGTAGPGTDVNMGVNIFGAGSRVTTTADGNITIDGTTAADSFSNHGISLTGAGVVESTSGAAGAGTITLTGTGMTGTQNNGVNVSDPNTRVSSVTGDIAINGTTAGRQGVRIVNAATVVSTGVASITIDGGSTGANAPNSDGVFLSDAGTAIQTADGNIIINGSATNTNSNNTNGVFGVEITGGAAVIEVGGGVDASATITGDSPVLINGGGTNVTMIGPVSITANDDTAAATDVDNVRITNAGLVRSTGSTVTISAGDNFLLEPTGVVRAADAVSITIDNDTPMADGGGGIANVYGIVWSDTAGITINGSGNDDTINIDNNGPVPAATPNPTVAQLTANDGTLDNIVTSAGNGLTVNGGGGAGDTLRLIDRGDTSADTFSITATTVSVGGTQDLFDSPAAGMGMNPGDGLTYTGLERIDIQTSNLAANGDEVTVTSLNATTFYFIDANGPTGLPGDILNLNTSGSNLNATEFEADLSITKSAVLDSVTDVLVYTVTVNNAGPSDAMGVIVTDTLPADVTFVETTGCAEDPNGVPTCTLGTIPAGGSAEYTIEVTVSATAPPVITNQASVTASTDDPDLTNNSVSLDTDVKALDPGFSYVDANNDHRFYPADGDVPLDDGELDDGRFDTRRREGPDYTTVIAGAGLVINGPPMAGGRDLRYTADGDLVVNTDLTAGDDIYLMSRNGSVSLDDPTISAWDEIEIRAALDIVSTDDVIEATGPRSEVQLRAGRDILLFGTTVSADRDVELRAGENIVVNDSGTPVEAVLTASNTSRGEVALRAGADIDVDGAELVAGKEVQLIAGGGITAVDAVMSALGNSRSQIELRATGDIDAGGATLSADDEIELRSNRGSISAVSAIMEALGNSNAEVQLLAATSINVASAEIRANRDVELRANRGSISAIDALMEALGSSRGTIELRAATDINATNAELRANREIEIRAGGEVDLTDALLDAGREIDIKSCTLIDTGATLTARRVKIRIC